MRCTSDANSIMSHRYIEGNVRASSSYRRYSANVPPFLWDRPTDLVKHVMCRMESSLTEQHVTLLSKGVFVVRSETEQGKTYQLSFGIEDRLPSCQCDDWKRHKLPCKHFCTIFKCVPGWTWEQLSQTYRELPLLNLDAACISAQTACCDERSEQSEPVPSEGKLTDCLFYTGFPLVIEFLENH